MPITLTRSHWLWIADAARCLDRTGRELPETGAPARVDQRGRTYVPLDDEIEFERNKLNKLESDSGSADSITMARRRLVAMQNLRDSL